MTHTTEFIFSALVSCLIIVIISGLSSFHNPNFRYSVIGYVLCLIMILGEHLVEYSGYSCEYPFTIFLAGPFHFAMAPMLNMVLLTLFEKQIRRKQFLLEMLPAVGVLLYMIPFYMLDGTSKCQYLTNYISSASEMAIRHKLLIIIVLLQITIYAVYWHHEIRSYSRLAKSRASSSTIEFIPWVSRILTLLVLFVFSIIATGLTRIYGRGDFYSLDQIENIIFSLTPHAFLLLLFFVNEKSFPKVSSVNLTERNGKLEADGKPGTNGKKTVDPHQVDQLLDLMKKEKLYLNPDLNLSDVADQMELSRHHLSDLLSHGVKKSFYDFVNEYRIEFAKELMTSDVINAYSLSGIAREAGFNNYVSFYRVFKRITGLTPSNFIKKKK